MQIQSHKGGHRKKGTGEQEQEPTSDERGNRRTGRAAQSTNTNPSLVTRNKAVTAAVKGALFTFPLLQRGQARGGGLARSPDAGERSGRGNEWA